MANRNITFFGIIFCLFSLLAPVYGQSKKAALTNEKKQLEKEIKQQRELLQQTQKNKKASLREIQLINSQVQKQERLIHTIHHEIDNLDTAIEANTKAVAELESELEVMKNDYAQAVYMAYKYRHVLNKAAFIASAENISQAVRRIRYLQEYSNALDQKMRLIQETQLTLKEKETLLMQDKQEKELLLQDGTRKKAQLDQQKKEKNQIVNKLKKQESQIQAEINKKIKRQKAVNAAIDKIIKEEIAKSNAKKSSAGGTKPTTGTGGAGTAASTPAHLQLTPAESALASDFESNKGKLPWPVEKGSIVTPFGPYTHSEVNSVRIPNDGVNIVTGKGSAVRAVFKGTVSGIATIGESKVVIIRHGNYLSVYSNLGEVYVQKGSNVTTKQAIGKVYSESGETTAELHFEIRKESTPLNPASWISR